MAPWLRDSSGNDVFDSINSPLSGSPMFDPVDVSETWGSAFGESGADAGSVVDRADSAVRGIANLPGMPGETSRSLFDVIQTHADYNDATGGADTEGGSPDPWNEEGLAVVVAVVVAAVSLYLLAPVLELATEVLDEE